MNAATMSRSTVAARTREAALLTRDRGGGEQPPPPRRPRSPRSTRSTRPAHSAPTRDSEQGPGGRSLSPTVIIRAGNERQVQAVREMDDARPVATALHQSSRRAIHELDRANTGRTRSAGSDHPAQVAGNGLDQHGLRAHDYARER